MTVDIETVEEIDAGDYTVRVGHGDGCYEAAVLSKSSTTSQPMQSGHPLARMTMVSMTTQTSDDSLESEPIGPTAEAPHKWVAIGLAIEMYEWQHQEGGPEDATDTYRQVAESIDMKLDIDAQDIVEDLEDDDDE